MLIYLDANIVQYCADYEDFIFGKNAASPTSDTKLLREFKALRTLVEVEQIGEGWEVAGPTHLIRELLNGTPTSNQRRIYGILLQAWQDSAWRELVDSNEEKIASIERSLRPLRLKDAPDRRHLAEAIAIEASWFLTNDRNIICRTRRKAECVGNVQGVRVARPAECIEDISGGLFLG